MPQFNLSDEELDDIVAFLKYASEINTAKLAAEHRGLIPAPENAIR